MHPSCELFRMPNITKMEQRLHASCQLDCNRYRLTRNIVERTRQRNTCKTPNKVNAMIDVVVNDPRFNGMHMNLHFGLGTSSENRQLETFVEVRIVAYWVKLCVPFCECKPHKR